MFFTLNTSINHCCLVQFQLEKAKQDLIKQKQDLIKVEQDVIRFISERKELEIHLSKELDSLKNHEGRITKLEGIC